ncbi:hypothetical protein sos41_38060 [Alphaproteobacteria bacterium SO-S41]|nr:hypothetical protein sos41_38060 [Alphaproteobacteria bacterium SO-S41]
MTYCLGIILPAGLVLASDSRSNAGVDQITVVEKLTLFTQPGERLIAILGAGNLATTQAVITTLRQGLDAPPDPDIRTLFNVRTLFDAAELVGDTLRVATSRSTPYVEEASASFLVSGQIKGEAHRLFRIFPEGNFVEASERAQFFQLGETKYGKPILDRALARATTLDETAKLALLSFDATMRSNVAVGPPIDMLRYTADSFAPGQRDKFDEDNSYWRDLTGHYSEGLVRLVESLPPPP